MDVLVIQSFCFFQSSDLEDFVASGEKQRIAVVGGVEDPMNICIIIDGNIIQEDIPDFPTALMVYFGVHYCLHLEYEKGQRKTMELIQKVFLNLDGNKLSPKVLSFKNKLLA